MKFLCDRCKTRYSIGDDRVRGKILKIRCKNCANVITVREGMSDEGAAVAEPGAASGRSARPTTMAPNPAHTELITGAKPPAALDEEWYVSIDGDQSGPYSLSEAQKWIAARPLDAELHCWSEGFDDWLPVDKVSHFRGLRKRPAAPAIGAPPPPPRTNVRPAPVEEEPKPLFAATMASLERGVAEQNISRPGVPASNDTARPGLPRSGANGAPAPIAVKGNGSGGAPTLEKSTTGPKQVPKLGAPQSLAPPASAPSPAVPTPLAKKSTGPTRAPRLQTQPGHTPAPLGVPGFDVASELDAPDGASAAAEPFAGVASTFAAKPAFPLPAPLPTPTPFAPQASLFPSSPDQPDQSDDDGGGLEIGEVSRVVNLADLMRQPAKKNQTAPVRRMTGANLNLARTGAVPKLDPGSLRATPANGTGALLTAPDAEAALLTPEALADAQQAELQLPPAPEQHRRSLVVLLLVAVVLLGGVGAVVAFVLMSSNETVQQLGLGPDQADQIDTTRPEDRMRHNPFIPPVGSNGGAATTPHTNPTNPPHHPQNPLLPFTPGSNGKVESDPLSPTSPLKPDEVEDMSAKQATGATRCWERALRKQPYLQKDIKKVSVTVTVDATGSIGNVQIAGMPTEDGGLGVCLQAFIRAWRFRQSSSGITAKFTMVFQNG